MVVNLSVTFQFHKVYKRSAIKVQNIIDLLAVIFFDPIASSLLSYYHHHQC